MSKNITNKKTKQKKMKKEKIKTNKISFVIASLVMVIIGWGVLNTKDVFAWTWTADFEDGTVGARAYGVSGYNGADTGTTTLFDNAQAHSGSQSSRFDWRVGEAGYSTNTGQIIYPGTVPRHGEVWIRAYYYFESGWQWNGQGTKIMRNHNSHSDGSHAKYTSIYTRSGQVSISIEPSAEDYEAASSAYFDIGSWQCIEIYVYNDETDGIVRIWKDGILLIETTTYGTMEQVGDYSNYSFLMSTWNTGPSRDQYNWIDDVIVTNETPANTDTAGNPMIGLDDPTYQCSDSIDNDGDTLIDYPNDPGCESATDNDETDPITIRADVNQDSQTNTTDAQLTLRNSLGLDMTSTNWQTSSTTGDVNCDLTSNSTDAMLLLRYSLGLDMSGTGWCE